jgi:hypothetical protein
VLLVFTHPAWQLTAEQRRRASQWPAGPLAR